MLLITLESHMYRITPVQMCWSSTWHDFEYNQKPSAGWREGVPQFDHILKTTTRVLNTIAATRGHSGVSEATVRRLSAVNTDETPGAAESGPRAPDR